MAASNPHQGSAILPESVAARHATPGVPFVRLAHARASLQTFAVTHADHGSLATAASLRALERTTTPHAAEPSGDVAALSA